MTGYFGIRAINAGKTAHALTISGQGLHQSTGMVQPGASKTIAVWFKKPGLYTVSSDAKHSAHAVIRVH